MLHYEPHCAIREGVGDGVFQSLVDQKVSQESAYTGGFRNPSKCLWRGSPTVVQAYMFRKNITKISSTVMRNNI